MVMREKRSIELLHRNAISAISVKPVLSGGYMHVYLVEREGGEKNEVKMERRREYHSFFLQISNDLWQRMPIN